MIAVGAIKCMLGHLCVSKELDGHSDVNEKLAHGEVEVWAFSQDLQARFLEDGDKVLA